MNEEDFFLVTGERMMAWTRSDETGLNSVTILKLMLGGFTNRLDVEHEREREKHNSKVFYLSIWKFGVAFSEM